MSRLAELLHRAVRSPRADWALAGLVLVAAEVGVWLQEDIPGGKPLSAATLAVASLALAQRRRFPLATLAVVVSAHILPALVAWESSQGGAGFVPFLVAVYSVARHASTLRAVGGWLVAVAGVAALVLLDPADANFDATWQASVATVTWFMGRAFRNRHLREDELRERAARLEREREERARAAVEEERARIARELHDVVAHNVSVIAVQAGAALEVLDGTPERARVPLQTIEATARQALAEMRRLLGVLRTTEPEEPLAPQPGLADLPELVEQVRSSGLAVELHVEGEPMPLEPGVDLSAYRIVQEALTNTLKHAGPARAEVFVRYGDGALDLEVVDDGAAPAIADGSGHGLVGMRERVAVYGGELQAGRRPGGGFGVRARLPVEAHVR